MLTFRQISSVAWTFMGFMLAAAVVLNMRYKPLNETNTLLLDTWTGRVERVTAENAAPTATERIATVESRRSGIDIILLEELAERRAKAHAHESSCGAIRFAFPAPGSRAPRR